MGEEYYWRETATLNFINILVEGQTEEIFVRDVLAPYLMQHEVFPTAKLATTKRVKSGKDFKGGINSYQRVKLDINNLLKDKNAKMTTTMIDYYGLPNDFPKYDQQPSGSLYEKVEFLEQAMFDDIGSHRFLPYLSTHEFEALLFVSTSNIATAFPDSDKQAELDTIKNRYDNPEYINLDNPPAKRLAQLYSGYAKTFHSALIASEIGINDIRNECPHFDQWITKIVQHFV